MALVHVQLRRGTYYDSVVLMKLQKALLDSVLDAAVVMGTTANKELIRQSGLYAPEVEDARAEDLIIAVKVETDSAGVAALAQVDDLLARHSASSALDQSYHPRSLESAVRQMPQARWVLISVPGRYAAGVAREALRLERNVFLYSDNVSLADEIVLKQTAAEKGLLMLGPDCGTAIIQGTGLGFSNRVRPGSIGVVGASGTGIQAVTVRIHELGAGVRQAIGTGTHDLSEEVGAITTRQALALLNQDPETRVIVLIAKSPSPSVAARLVAGAQALDKPVVINFVGRTTTARMGNVHLTRTLSEAADTAVELIVQNSRPGSTRRGASVSKGAAETEAPAFASSQRFLRGLYSGGTLAYEAQLLLREPLGAVYSNAPNDATHQLEPGATSREHTILDLGADEFTVGRLHPMLDNDLRVRRLRQEADDPAVAVILFDLVLGYGTHPDPASELGPAIRQIRERAHKAGRPIFVIVSLIGTDQDPQNLALQSQRLKEAGAHVETDHAAAVSFAGEITRTLGRGRPSSEPPLPTLQLDHSSGSFGNEISFPQVAAETFRVPFAAINVGLESFYDSLKKQNVPVLDVDWRPPAGGNEKLMAIVERLKNS